MSGLGFKELDQMSKDEDRWAVKLTVFKELVEHLIQEEETRSLDDADRALNEQQMKSVYKRFQEEKLKVQGSSWRKARPVRSGCTPRA